MGCIGEEIKSSISLCEVPMNVNNHSQGNRCYTVSDLMEILGIGRIAVYSLLKREEFRVIRLPSVGYRIPKDSFDRWMAENTCSDAVN